MLTLFVLLIFGCKPATSLRGTYSWSNEFRGINYYFHSDSTFSCYGWSDSSRDTGVGKYRITKDSIYFVYDKLEFANASTVTADSVIPSGDSCIIELISYDDHGYLANAGFFLITPQGTIGTSTKSGYCTLKVSRDDFPLVIQCTGVKTAKASLRINSPADCVVRFHMELTDAASISAGTRAGMKFKMRRNKIEFRYSRSLNGGGREITKQKLVRVN